MAKKFANILGLNSVFIYNSETNTYRTDLLVNEIKNEVDYNTICFIKANSLDDNRKIGNYTIKENDTFIVSQKEVFAINPKDGFSSNVTEGTNISITNGIISANGYTYNPSNYSFAEGNSTITQNTYEHAEGKYNVSNVGTISSIGIGTSDTDRMNAIEVMDNGDVYIKNIGDYNGKHLENVYTLQSIISSLQQTNTELSKSNIELSKTNTELQTLVTKLANILTASGIVNNSDILKTPTEINYSEYFENKNLSEVSISVDNADTQTLKIKNVYTDNTDLLSNKVKIDISFVTQPTNYENYKSIMIKDAGGYIYCFRDIESSSYDSENDTYTFNISWENNGSELNIYTTDLFVLYPKTVGYYALGVNH